MRRAAAVAALAAASRLLLLGCMTALDALHADYDTSSSLYRSSCGGLLDHPLAAAGWPATTSVWDTIFYMRIAKCGYEFEQYHAFFPLLPALIRAVKYVASWMSPVRLCSDSDALLAISGLLVSNAAFIISALYLDRYITFAICRYRQAAEHKCSLWLAVMLSASHTTIMGTIGLSRAILLDERLSALATVLYCFNPASVFYAAAYTEGLFAALSFTGMWYLHQPQHYWRGVACFALATAARSNGLLNGWFVAHWGLRRLLQAWPRKKMAAAGIILRTAAAGAAVAAPFVGFQYFGWLQLCHPRPAPGSAQLPPPWCSSQRVPYLYGYVQSHYWGVGFLKYWQPQQIPNFLLAAPVLLLSACGCLMYFRADWQRALSLGILPTFCRSMPQTPSGQHVKPLRSSSSDTNAAHHPSVPSTGFLSDVCAVYMYHWVFMAAFALCCMHVQVATRFLSVCPPLYWFAAHLCTRGYERKIWAFFLSYLLLGALLFSNYYPWT